MQKGAEKNKDALVNQVKTSWTDTSDSASNAFGSVKDWIFDRYDTTDLPSIMLQAPYVIYTDNLPSWTDSQLKAFADRHSIPVPQPRKRDTLLKTVRENYQSVANKLGETAAYPGDWLYAAWSDSDLKAFLDERGIPAPQPNTRDKLIASVRRNARAASLTSKSAASSLSSSAEAAQTSLTEKIFDSWSDSELKNWADKNGIKVPQGSTRNEILAIARKNAAKLTGDNASAAASGSGSSVTSKGASAMGAATSSAGNAGARATEDASLKANNFADAAYSQLLQYYEDAQIALGLKTNYASSASKSAASASKSAASAYAKASKDAKGEL